MSSTAAAHNHQTNHGQKTPHVHLTAFVRRYSSRPCLPFRVISRFSRSALCTYACSTFVGTWLLGFLWCLVIGAWCFSFPRSPNLPHHFLRPPPIRARIALLIRPVPSWPIRCPGRHDAAAGHLQMSDRIGLLHPFPGVPQPVVAFLLGQERKPRDLVPAPDER